MLLQPEMSAAASGNRIACLFVCLAVCLCVIPSAYKQSAIFRFLVMIPELQITF